MSDPALAAGHLPEGHKPHHRNGRVECDCGWVSPVASPAENFPLYVDHLYPKPQRRWWRPWLWL